MARGSTARSRPRAVPHQFLRPVLETEGLSAHHAWAGFGSELAGTSSASGRSTDWCSRSL